VQALLDDSAEGVHTACKADPGAAATILWDFHCSPPLCAAAQLGCGPEVISALLEHGADATLRDTRGRSALDILRRCDEGQLPDDVLASIALLGGRQVISALLEHGADVTLRDTRGRSALDILQRCDEGQLPDVALASIALLGRPQDVLPASPPSYVPLFPDLSGDTMPVGREDHNLWQVLSLESPSGMLRAMPIELLSRHPDQYHLAALAA